MMIFLICVLQRLTIGLAKQALSHTFWQARQSVYPPPDLLDPAGIAWPAQVNELSTELLTNAQIEELLDLRPVQLRVHRGSLRRVRAFSNIRIRRTLRWDME